MCIYIQNNVYFSSETQLSVPPITNIMNVSLLKGYVSEMLVVEREFEKKAKFENCTSKYRYHFYKRLNLFKTCPWLNVWSLNKILFSHWISLLYELYAIIKWLQKISRQSNFHTVLEIIWKKRQFHCSSAIHSMDSQSIDRGQYTCGR